MSQIYKTCPHCHNSNYASMAICWHCGRLVDNPSKWETPPGFAEFMRGWYREYLDKSSNDMTQENTEC